MTTLNQIQEVIFIAEIIGQSGKFHYNIAAPKDSTDSHLRNVLISTHGTRSSFIMNNYQNAKFIETGVATYPQCFNYMSKKSFDNKPYIS